MSWSLTEARTLSVKAARGAGFPWGLAQEAGFAVQKLHACGLPGVAALASYLQHIENAGFEPSKNPERCPIRIGAACMDQGEVTSSPFQELCQPLLLAPFLAGLGKSGTGVLSWDKVECHIHPTGVTITRSPDACLQNAEKGKWKPGDAVEFTGEYCSRVDDEMAEFVQILERFAHNTYAPSTEQSRLAGAGAGLSDND